MIPSLSASQNFYKNQVESSAYECILLLKEIHRCEGWILSGLPKPLDLQFPEATWYVLSQQIKTRSWHENPAVSY